MNLSGYWESIWSAYLIFGEYLEDSLVVCLFCVYLRNYTFSYENLDAEADICRCSMILLISVSPTMTSRKTISDLSLLIYDLMIVCLWCDRSLMISSKACLLFYCSIFEK